MEQNVMQLHGCENVYVSDSPIKENWLKTEHMASKRFTRIANNDSVLAIHTDR